MIIFMFDLRLLSIEKTAEYLSISVTNLTIILIIPTTTCNCQETVFEDLSAEVNIER